MGYEDSVGALIDTIPGQIITVLSPSKILNMPGNSDTSVLAGWTLTKEYSPDDGIYVTGELINLPTDLQFNLQNYEQRATINLYAQWTNPIVVLLSPERNSTDWNDAYSRLSQSISNDHDQHISTVLSNFIVLTNNNAKLGNLGRIPATIIGGSNGTFSYSDVDRKAISISNSKFLLNADTQFENVKLNNSQNTLGNGYGIYASGHHLIMGEKVSTGYTLPDAYNIGDSPDAVTHSGFIIYGGSISTNVANTNITILGGEYSAIYGTSKSVSGNSLVSVEAGKIYALYGGGYDGGSTNITNLIVHGGTIYELIAGPHYGTSKKTHTEILGGDVYYINGGPRVKEGNVGTTDGIAVEIFVRNGNIDYLFGGAKDANNSRDDAYPVVGKICINIIGGTIHTVYGGGYDFWNKPTYPGLNGTVHITISGGTFGIEHSAHIPNGADHDGYESYTKKAYYSKSPGIFGGGYRGAIVADVSISIYGNAEINCNIYGGGAGGPDDSAATSGSAYLDKTGQSYVDGTTTINIGGDAEIVGNIYGGGMGVEYLGTNGSGWADVAKVTDNTNILITGSASITGNIYGGGKGFSSTQSNPSMINFLQIANVGGDSTVSIGGLTTINGNVYGGGEFGLIGKITISEAGSWTLGGDGNSGNTIVMTNGGTITGDVFGGGKGTNTWTSEHPVAQDLSKVIFGAVSNSTYVYIKDSEINGNIFGGGELGIVGTYSDNPDPNDPSKTLREFIGGNSEVIINNSKIGMNVYGGGQGTPNNSVSGAVGKASVIIGGDSDIGTTSGGNVYGGGGYSPTGSYVSDITNVGDPHIIASDNTASTYVAIYGGTVRGDVFGAGLGSKAVVTGSTSVQIGANGSTNNVSITDIAIHGEIYGGGERGDVGFSNNEYSTVINGVSTGVCISANNGQKIIIGTAAKDSTGNIYGGGKGGYLIDIPEGTADNVELPAGYAVVSGNTDVAVSGANVKIMGSVFGGGKGLSSSVYIEPNAEGSTELTSLLYNLIDATEDVIPDDYQGITRVSSYTWQGADYSETFVDIENGNNASLNISGLKYTQYRLKVLSTDGETYYSNVLKDNGTSVTSSSSRILWEQENVELVRHAEVLGDTSVTINSGTIAKNIFGGGSYGAVGIITTGLEEIDVDRTHEITGGNTRVTINDGIIGSVDGQSHTVAGTGNVFGGGMGEADNVTAGSVGGSTSVTIKNGAVHGNVYGGGESGSVGNLCIDIQDTKKWKEDRPASVQMYDTNTYYFKLGINSTSASAETGKEVGYTTVDIEGGTFLGQTDPSVGSNIFRYTEGNIFGGGYGVNAAVTGYTNVTITGGEMNGVYGGGEMGIIGAIFSADTSTIPMLSNGETNVKITGSSTSNVIINGDVYGGGKGIDTNDAEEIILGAVGFKTNVTIGADDTEAEYLKIKGSVYGGGELGIVGSYKIIWKDAVRGPIDHIVFNHDQYDEPPTHGGAAPLLTESSDDSYTYVTINSGTIYQNVYGGGKGKIGVDNLFSGAVGNTSVTIAGKATYINDKNNPKYDTISSDHLIIGYAEKGDIKLPGYFENKTTAATVSSSADKDLTYDPKTPSNESADPPTTNVYLSVLKPAYGSIIITNPSGLIQSPIDQVVKNKEIYDVYKFAPGVKLTLTYETNFEQGYHVSTWYNVDAEGTYSITSAEFTTVANTNTTIWVEEDNHYYLNIVQPSFGSIIVNKSNGDEFLPGEDESTTLNNVYCGIYKLAYGTQLTFTYVDDQGSDNFVKTWVASPSNDIVPNSDPNTAYLTLAGDVEVSTLEGPGIGNVYGGGAYGIVGSAQITPVMGENGKITHYAPYGTDNDAKTLINITGGKIGFDGSGSLATGNVFGGGYGPSAHILGSTWINIGLHKNSNDLGEDIDTDIGILGNVFGGGEMGSIGYVDYESGVPTGTKQSISTNISIESHSSHAIKIGAAISEGNEKTFSDLWGNIFGGGQGRDLPPAVTEPLQSVHFALGYAIVYGETNVFISGNILTTENTPPSNVIIGGSVYGSGEGLLRYTNSKTLDSESSNYGKVTGAYAVNGNTADDPDATHIHIQDALIRKSVFGGGKLSVVGNVSYDKDNLSTSNHTFTGKETRVYVAGRVTGNVFGGGEGHALSAIAGATGDTMIVIAGNAQIGAKTDGKPTSVISANGFLITSGNVYGGGRIAITGNFTVGPDQTKLVPTSSSNGVNADNQGKTMIVILGGTILNSVYGGGFSPEATVAGSTEVYLGAPPKTVSLANGFDSTLINPKVSDIVIEGSVYGGGEMAAVGTTVLELTGTDGQLDPGQKTADDKWVSTNVIINSDGGNRITIAGNVYGGGKGILYSQLNGIIGYAAVRGDTYVEVKTLNGTTDLITIEGSVYGGGQGAQGNLNAVHYGEVYDRTVVVIENITVKGSVYGGGEFGIIGHFTDSYPKLGDKITLTYHGKLMTGEITNVTDVEGDAPLVTITGTYVDGTPETIENTTVTIRDFCSDDLGNSKIKAYTGRGTTAVNVTDCKINGSVYGGGKGVEISVLAGAVGRGTTVTVKDNSVDDLDLPNSKTEILGNVFGGGELGIVGSVTTQIVGTAMFSPVKVTHVSHMVGSLDNSLDETNDTNVVVNIHGGKIHGSVFGAGKGEEIRVEGVDYGDLSVSYYKLSVFGRAEVNISGGIINKHVYGGSENGEVGALKIMNDILDFANNYFDSNPNGDWSRGSPSDIPEDVRDNYPTSEYNPNYKDGVPADLPQFSATIVNIVGGTVYGNVFGGGYFGAIYGNTHLHIGWNSVMPYDSGSNGDCQYYNDYDNTSYGHKTLPFVARNPDGTVKYNDGSTGPKDAVKLTKDATVHDLKLNGTIYAGSDRGDPNAITVNYDYISVYGTSHITLNGTGYNTGTDQPQKDDSRAIQHAMYLQGSVFGSGNSCTTFYSDKANSRFITFKNYDATNDNSDKLNNYIIYSIQRATEVTLINSSLRLPGRSNGSNLNPSALYSLNHIDDLILSSGSTLILDTVVQDLRGLKSIDGTGALTTPENTDNIIQLNNGIILIIAGLQETKPTANASDFPSEATEQTLSFEDISGYFLLDLDDTKYYSGYVYGEFREDMPLRGFLYGASFTTEATRKEITRVDTANYSYWYGGGGHSSSVITLFTDGDNKQAEGADHIEGFNSVMGSAQLPLTGSNTSYMFVGMNVYPAQANKLGEGSIQSLHLLKYDYDRKSLVWNDQTNNKNTDFGLYMQMGKGFDGSADEYEKVWLDPTNPFTEHNKITNASAVGGSTLPEMNFYLYYKDGINKTNLAGNVEIIVQEVTLKNNEVIGYGNEIRIVVNIEAQEIPNEGEHLTVDQSLTLYPSRTEGKYTWNLSIPPIGIGGYNGDTNKYQKYDIYLTGILEVTGIKLADAPSGNDTFKIVMTPRDGFDNSEGWDGRTVEYTLLNDGSLNDKFLGRTDGRYTSLIEFTIYNEKIEDTNQMYATGQLKLGAVAVNADNPDDRRPLSVTISTDNALPNYRIVFDAQGGSSVMSQHKDQGAYVDEPLDPVRFDDQGNKLAFLGWYTDLDYTQEYIFIKGVSKDPVESNLLLYAKWGYAVNFHSNIDDAMKGLGYKEEIKTVGVNDSGIVAPSDIPDWSNLYAGYEFEGWYATKDASIKWTSTTPITESIDVYAKWEAKAYQVTYNPNGGSGTAQDENTYTLGATVTLHDGAELTYDGHYLSGWTYKNKFYAKGALFTMPAENVEFMAVWIPDNTYNVIINSTVSNADFTYSYTDSTGAVENSATGEVRFTVPQGTVVTVSFKYGNGSGALSGYTPVSGNEWEVSPNTIKISPDEVAEAGILSATFTIGDIDDGDKTVTITAQFIGNNYDVTFDANGGTFGAEDIIITKEQIIGSKYELPSAPTKQSAEFLGWYTERTGGSPIGSTVPYLQDTSSVTFYAHWLEYEYYLVLNSGGANVGVKNIPVAMGKPVKLVNDFIFPNYKFVEWKYSLADGTSGTFEDGYEFKLDDHLALFDQDHKLTLTADWGAEDFTVTVSDKLIYNAFSPYWDSNGPHNGLEITITSSGGSIIINEDTYSTYSSLYAFQWVQDSDILDSVQDAGTYHLTVKEMMSNGEGSAAVTISPKTIISDMIKIDNQNDSLDYHGQNTQPTVIVNDSNGATTKLLEINIDYAVKSYRYEIDNANNTAILQVNLEGRGNYTGPVQQSIILNFRQYIILGTVSFADTTPANGVTVSLVDGEGNILENFTAKTAVDGKYEISGVPYGTKGTLKAVLTGYSSQDIPLSIDTNYSTVSEIVQNFTLQANEYSVKYDLNGVSGVAPTDSHKYTLESGRNIIILTTETPSRTGYQFLGWAYSATATASDLIKSPITLDATAIERHISDGNVLTLYAVWQANEYSVEYDLNGGTGATPDADTVTIGAAIPLADTTGISRTGYTLLGWSFDQNAKSAIISGTKLTAEDIDAYHQDDKLILYAVWRAEDSPPTYKVQYDANGGLGDVPQDNHRYWYGERVTVLEGDLSKTGYIFQGWCDEISGKLYHAGDVFNMPNRDVCLKANWTLDGSLPENQATVIFCVDDEEYAQVIVSKGTALDDSMPSDPIKEGFDFAGWYVGEEEFTSATIVNGNLTVYAKWTLNEDYVIVSFIIDNELYLTKVCKKDNITEPNIQHSQNKQINGWYVDQELQNKFDFNTVVTTSHLTLYAEWQDNTNLMIYFIFLLFAAMIAAVIASTKRVSFYENKNDEEKYESVLMIGSGAIGDKLPTISNDNFRGWYTEQGEQITEETKITQSMKVYARWKE